MIDHLKKYDGLTILGTAGLIVAAAFYALKRSMPYRAESPEVHP